MSVDPGHDGDDGDGADRDRACLVALASLDLAGPATLVRCARHGAARAWAALCAGRYEVVWPKEAGPDAERARWRARREAAAAQARAIDPAALLGRHRQAGIDVVVQADRSYPARLAADPAPPAVLFARGDLGALSGPAVGIVGTRNATRLGRATAAELGEELAARGVAVVSGLALGVDGAAHRGALAAGPAGSVGRPVGVVAAGLDRPYPRVHRDLHDQVAQAGLVVGEVPLGGAPLRWRFPARNRILAGLVDALVVVESRSAGGSMLTVTEALRRDVPVLAVPGHPRSPAAAGPLDLISEGAVPVRDVDDVLVAVGLGGRRRVGPPSGSDRRHTQVAGPSDAAGQAVLAAVDGAPATFEQVVLATGMALEEVAVTVARLEAAGVLRHSGAWLERDGGWG